MGAPREVFYPKRSRVANRWDWDQEHCKVRSGWVWRSLCHANPGCAAIGDRVICRLAREVRLSGSVRPVLARKIGPICAGFDDVPGISVRCFAMPAGSTCRHGSLVIRNRSEPNHSIASRNEATCHSVRLTCAGRDDRSGRHAPGTNPPAELAGSALHDDRGRNDLTKDREPILTSVKNRVG